MELLSVIRRWHHRDHIPIREIQRRIGLSRNTIRKYLRSNAVEVRFKVPERPSRLDPFADKLSDWLRVEAGKDAARAALFGATQNGKPAPRYVAAQGLAA